MQAIGDRLREARMRQKIDIAEVESATKIRAKYLRALENEEFGLLPGSTFVKSFLRTYAEYLGLDPQLLVEEYRAQHEPREQSELQPFATTTPPPRGRERRPRGGPPRPALVAVGVILLVLVGLAILGLTGEEPADDGGSEEARQEQTAREERGERRERRGRRERAPAPETVRLRIVPADPTYVCVDDGKGNVKFEGTLSSAQTFRGRRVRINLGRRSAEVTANGRRVPISSSPEPIALDFSGGKRAELPAERAPCA